MIGVITNEKTVQFWTNSHHSCSQLESESMSFGKGKYIPDSKHKEESAGRIKSDSVDREKIRSSLQQCIHPLQIESHDSNTVVNVYTGK